MWGSHRKGTKPSEKKLEDIALRLPDGTSLSGLVEQVKGARVSVEVGSERIEGVVLGIESQWRNGGTVSPRLRAESEHHWYGRGGSCPSSHSANQRS